MIHYYHNANILNLERLGHDLRFNKVPNFGGMMNIIHSTNVSLQLVETVLLEREQPWISEGLEVLIAYPGDWNPVHVDARAIWLVLKVMYRIREIRPKMKEAPARIFFYPTEEVRFPDILILARRAACLLARAEIDGTMTFIRGLPFRYGATHAPLHDSLATFPSLPFPCMYLDSQSEPTSSNGSTLSTSCKEFAREFRARQHILEILQKDSRDENGESPYPWVDKLPSDEPGFSCRKGSSAYPKHSNGKCSLHQYKPCSLLTSKITASSTPSQQLRWMLLPASVLEEPANRSSSEPQPEEESQETMNVGPSNSASTASSPSYHPESPLISNVELGGEMADRPHPVIGG